MCVLEGQFGLIYNGKKPEVRDRSVNILPFLCYLCFCVHHLIFTQFVQVLAHRVPHNSLANRNIVLRKPMVYNQLWVRNVLDSNPGLVHRYCHQ
jgi:hypothetical protein